MFSLIMLFGLTSSSRLFFSQRFGRLILRPSSGLSRTRELWNFEPNPLLFRGYHVLIPLRPLLLLLLNAVAAAAASIDAVTAIVLSLPLHSGLNSAPSAIGHMAEATKALNQKLEVPQGAEFNPECSGSDKTMAVAVTKQWQ